MVATPDALRKEARALLTMASMLSAAGNPGRSFLLVADACWALALAAAFERDYWRGRRRASSVAS